MRRALNFEDFNSIFEGTEIIDAMSLKFIVIQFITYWRAREASETLSGMYNSSFCGYIYHYNIFLDLSAHA